MLLRRVYYSLKPYVPWRLRMTARRIRARQVLKTCADQWPILESAARKPDGWPGWPHGKQFAFVLTHDVESQRGLDRVKQLAELEMSLGFRSSFNFIPEGTYTVPASLREWLTERGFEVGVHDLHHDGKLYSSHEEFVGKAKRINHFLKEWNAVGFRSGFMLRNLNWLGDLDLQYDASTFDTDPFEPQPDGVSTIFPFWVTALGRTRSGYVELPYTLPQDSTLFVVLQQRTSEIWKRKLDWIALHGGMALANIHPDYIQFDGEQPTFGSYPVARIREFLEYASDTFGKDAWNSTPDKVAAWFRRARISGGESGTAEPASIPVAGDGGDDSLTGKRAAILLYSYYPADPRPRRAAEALAETGMQVDLLCLRESDAEPEQEMVRGVHVYRTPMQRKRDSKVTYLKQYCQFIVRSFIFLARHSPGRSYDLVHVHNMPDVLVFAALLPKLCGARILLDLHDPMPELMESIYGLKSDDLTVRFLRRLERWSIGFSDLALTPNITFKNLFVSRSCRPEKMQIVMNSPQQEIFDPERFAPGVNGADRSGEFHVMHHGSIVHRHGVDLLVEAVARLRQQIPGIRLDIYGAATPFLAHVLGLAESLGIADIVTYHGAKTQIEIAEAILKCQVGVVPNRRSAFIEINFPTRLFEYLAMHRPVIAPATKGIMDYFGSEELVTFEPGSVDELAKKIMWVKTNPKLVEGLVERGRHVYRKNLWNTEKARFVNLVTALLTEGDHEPHSAHVNDQDTGVPPTRRGARKIAVKTTIER